MAGLLDVDSVSRIYTIHRGLVSRQKTVIKAVDDVSFSMPEGESVGLVGESGCGKSTLAKMMVGLVRPTTGCIRYQGREIGRPGGLGEAEFRRNVQMVFQDPFSSLNPRRCVSSAIEYPMRIHRVGTGLARRNRALQLMEKVGLDPRSGDRYPHQFSGGQRQRIAIARALALEPTLVILDEPVSSLDVSIQAQILNLLLELKRDLALTYLFISHDLKVVHYVCDRVMVMYLGRIVEVACPQALLSTARHPYSRLLFSSSYAGAQGHSLQQAVDVEMQAAAYSVSGCGFRPRCSLAGDRCAHEAPVLKQVDSDCWVACHLA